ncbi:hypothetical protein DFH27DRAFT_570122 [Peziza echinospora]|nr:hypothetical protein DFH27DRAFT_570122 [Peziza echinospora]
MTDTTQDPPAPPKTPGKELSREALHAVSAEFLASDKLKDAPVSEKKEFLKLKGLTEAEIETLLERVEKGRERAAEKVDVPVPVVEGADKVEGEGEKSDREVRVHERSFAPTQTQASGTSTEMVVHSAPASVPVPQQQQFQQPPLIVTYPEFLAPPPAPPAPVNAKSLVTGMYLAGAAAATVYGASKFLFQPMFDSLTSARSELAQTALTNLNEFNSKLSVLVPNRRFPSSATTGVTIGAERRPGSPNSQNGTSSAGQGTSSGTTTGPGARSLDNNNNNPNDDSDSENDSDAESTTSSLRTHLFHVDASTQTIPESDDPEDSSDPTKPSPSDKKLAHISSHLATLIDSNSDAADSDLQFELQSLTSYLDSLHYEGSSLYGPPLGAGAWPLAGGAGTDSVARLKAEIRSVKGVFLNTKNFPAGR